MELNDSEIIMTQISALHLTETQGMKLFANGNITMARSTYYALKYKVALLTKRRLTDIAKELPEEHLKTLDLINLIEQKLIAKMVGATEPKSAVPGTIRGDFSHQSYAYADEKNIAVRNIIHASSSVEDSKKEIDLWFSQAEIYNYETVHEKHTQ